MAMRATELIGKRAVRTEPSKDGDRGYYHICRGVTIKYASDKIIVVDDGMFGDHSLDDRWCDDNWMEWPEPKRDNAIVIRARKEVKDGKAGYRVVEVRALEREHLPEEYLEGKQHCFKAKETLIIRSCTSNGFICCYNLLAGSWHSKKIFNSLLDEVKKCGTRLHEINKKARAEREAWQGEETFRI